MRLFNPAVFNSAVFNTGADEPEPEEPGGYQPIRPMRLTLDLTPKDDDEEALLVAFLRHRFRL